MTLRVIFCTPGRDGENRVLMVAGDGERVDVLRLGELLKEIASVAGSVLVI